MARVVLDPAGMAKLGQAVDRMLTTFARAIADDARRYVPVDTGATRAGIEAEDGRSGVARVSVSRDIPGDDPDVPLYLEFGTRNMDAQPFMRPALYQRRRL